MDPNKQFSINGSQRITLSAGGRFKKTDFPDEPESNDPPNRNTLSGISSAAYGWPTVSHACGNRTWPSLYTTAPA